MDLTFLPMVLFPAGTILCLWMAAAARREARAARFPLALAGFGLLLTANEWFQFHSGNAIRIDLLLTIPLFSAAAMLAGIMGLRRSRIAATLLILGPGLALALFLFSMVKTGAETARLGRIFNRRRQLYWEETLRCQSNFNTRFGLGEQPAGGCSGHWLASRPKGGYPFTRLILNDALEAYLLFSPEAGVEENWGMTQDDPAARLSPSGAGWAGPCTGTAQCTSVRVFPRDGGCAAEVQMPQTGVTALDLRPAPDLPACERPAQPPVTFAGAYGGTFPLGGNPPVLRLVQVWLWDSGGPARAVLVEATGSAGRGTRFNFARLLQGSRRAVGEFELAVLDPQGRPTDRSLTVSLPEGAEAVVSGSAVRLPSGAPLRLRRQELVSHPKISLAPVYDRARFSDYFDNVLHNLDVPWNVPK